ncbi:E3 ubiquitin-protein ligase-like protein [Drosera capensis]
MDQSERQTRIEHVIDITGSSDASSSGSAGDGISNYVDLSRHGDRPSSNTRTSVSQSSLPVSNNSNLRSTSLGGRGSTGNSHSRRRRSPLNSRFWISVEVFLTLGQIIASVVVLCLSKHEHPPAPLSAWVIGYVAGCVGLLPLIYWRFLHRNQVSEQDSAPTHPISSINNPAGHDGQASNSTNRNASDQSVGARNPSLKILVDYFKRILDCFFAIWFVVGIVWIFGGHASSSEAPKLYRLCMVLLIFSCIGYALPFILCTAICCCLPCIISVLGLREDLNQTKGATSESINALPTYKVKLRKSKNVDGTAAGECLCVAVGAEKERAISGEDAACCICLSKYANNDELRELPCDHLFHKECVDKWLKMNALCPLCKAEVGETVLNSLAVATTSLRNP